MSHLKQEDFLCFKAECERLIEVLGLTEWDPEYRFAKLEDCYAQVEMNCEGKAAIFSLNIEWPDVTKLTKTEVRRTAMHEVLHLALYPVRAAGEKRYTREGEMGELEEAVVNRLCRAMHGKC